MVRSVKFFLWNTAGALSMRVGKRLYNLGLHLCGLAGKLDSIADDHR